MKALSIRLDNQLGRQFDRLCQQLGYKKNTLITRLVAGFVAHHSKNRTKKLTAGRSRLLRAAGTVEMPPLLSPNEIDEIVYNI